MLGGMLLFYIGFFFILYRRAIAMSRLISTPLQQMNRMVQGIAAGDFRQPPVEHPVIELKQSADGIVEMGCQIERSRSDLETRQAQLRQLFNLNPAALVAIDGHDRILMVNAQFEALTGSPVEAWPGKARDDLWAFMAALCDPEQQPTPELQEQECRIPGKPPIHIHISQTRYEMRLPGDIACLIAINNVSREKELAALKNEFINLASHEMRTPMTSIFGLSELLRNDLLQQEDRQESIEIIHEQARRLVAMNDDFLMINNETEGVVCEHSLMLQELVEATTTDFVAPKGRTAPILKRNTQAIVQADRKRFIKVLGSIIDNAYKYSEAGEVSIEAGVQDDAGRIAVTVRDQSIGIAPENLERVFQRFWREDKSGAVPGSGLGLPLARQLMESMGGSIEISSTPGEGTAVTLWLRGGER